MNALFVSDYEKCCHLEAVREVSGVFGRLLATVAALKRHQFDYSTGNTMRLPR